VSDRAGALRRECAIRRLTRDQKEALAAAGGPTNGIQSYREVRRSTPA
jgi:predicted GIY-YIG superfamily endonuclease